MAGKNGSTTTAAALEADCACGDVSIGDATARVGLSFERKQLTLVKADKFLVGHRLTVNLSAQEDGADPDQQALPGMEQTFSLDAVVDVKKIGVSVKKISCNLTFSLEDVEVGVLAKFAKKTARLTVHEINEIPVTAKAPKPASEEDEDD